MTTPVDPPNLDLAIDGLVDWLELSALFNEFGIARVDSMIGSLTQLVEEAEDDIGEKDKLTEQLIEGVENEILTRMEHLRETYPFKLSDGAEEVQLDVDWRQEQHLFYLVCLVTSHTTGSSILKTPPVGPLLTRLRNRVFQILSTLAMAGLAGGPAISVGWPRVGGEPMLALLQRAVAAGAGFTVRNPPSPFVPPEEKDGGIDVIAWSAEVSPPPANFYFAQSASGNNWPGKPVSNHADVFANSYMLDHMTGNISHATLIPFRVADPITFAQQSLYHRAVLDRLRLPYQAWIGLQRSQAGVVVDEADQMPVVLTWMEDYRAFALA
jgi:hypothetical protein